MRIRFQYSAILSSSSQSFSISPSTETQAHIFSRLQLLKSSSAIPCSRYASSATFVYSNIKLSYIFIIVAILETYISLKLTSYMHLHEAIRYFCRHLIDFDFDVAHSLPISTTKISNKLRTNCDLKRRSRSPSANTYANAYASMVAAILAFSVLPSSCECTASTFRSHALWNAV